ncbi:hypothetical protein BDN72DRAFT_502881 [Pluteus cervinus]|uniref:Uncharacterized protein n=1 Tax=Pluteus cervinus TaxID=181527 RepID=A0ACD3AZP8_9AGAR|nr:hypothetical protein BDN72DRAFT_502881 [Pluteus cervinus]
MTRSAGNQDVAAIETSPMTPTSSELDSPEYAEFQRQQSMQREINYAGQTGQPVPPTLGLDTSTPEGARAPTSGPRRPTRSRPYTPANRYKTLTLFVLPAPDSGNADTEAAPDSAQFNVNSAATPTSPPGKPRSQEATRVTLTWKMVLIQVYLHVLLRLPDMYWNRLDKIFRDTDDEPLSEESEDDFTHSPSFKPAWERFVESLIKEWETLNVVAALLLSAIFTIFQINSAANDNVTTTLAILSFACALMGLLYGCMYIIRFGSLKRVVEARHWVEKMQQEDDRIHRHLWNEWILLAMPAVWLCWSILLFVACILSFVWRANTSQSSDGPTFGLAAQTALTVLVGLGVIYFFAIVWSFRIGWEKSPKWKR